MRPATERKVKEIKNRALDLKRCFPEEMHALKAKAKGEEVGQEELMIPRVSGMIIREGKFLLKIADKFIERHEPDLDAKEKAILDEAREFFDEMAKDHKEEVAANLFIYRLPSIFVIHLEKLANLIIKFDGQVRAKIAEAEMEDEGDDERMIQREIDAEVNE